MSNAHDDKLNEVGGIKLPDYVACELNLNPRVEPHDVSRQALADEALKVIQAEGPVHTTEIARRIANGHGKTKVGARILGAVKSALVLLQHKVELIEDQDFWLVEEQVDNPPARARANASGLLQKAELISPIELRAIGDLVTQEFGPLEPDAMAREITRAMGFKQAGTALKNAINAALYPAEEEELEA